MQATVELPEVVLQQLETLARREGATPADGGLRPTLVQGGVGGAHLVGLGTGRFELNERALAHAGAPTGGLVPMATGFQKLRPEGEEAALGGFGRMDPAAVGAQEGTQAAVRHAQAHAVARAVDVLAFKCGRGHTQEGGGAGQVGFSQVDETFLAATFRTAGLALETQGVGHGWES